MRIFGSAKSKNNRDFQSATWTSKTFELDRYFLLTKCLHAGLERRSFSSFFRLELREKMKVNLIGLWSRDFCALFQSLVPFLAIFLHFYWICHKTNFLHQKVARFLRSLLLRVMINIVRISFGACTNGGGYSLGWAAGVQNNYLNSYLLTCKYCISFDSWKW